MEGSARLVRRPGVVRAAGTIAAAMLLWTAGAAAQVFSTPRGTVSNVRFERVGTTFTILYDLASTDDAAIFKVTLEVSFDKGQTFSFKPAAVSGDIGEGVKAGRNKKITWLTSRDTENQEFDQFRFMPVVLSGTARPVERLGILVLTTNPSGAAVIVDGQPSGTTPVTLNLSSGKHSLAITKAGYDEVRDEIEIEGGKTKPVDRKLNARADQPSVPTDLRGRWRGSYPGALPAQLTIERQEGSSFFGTLSVTTTPGKDSSEVQIEGRLSGQALEIREVRVLALGAAPRWNLGTATGILQSEGRQMSGSGTDGRSSYQWRFSRGDGSGTPGAGTATDVRGSWEGTYANSPARLTIDRQDGADFSGTLSLTTKAGKEPSEVLIEGRALDGNVDLHEVRVLKLGAASAWSLGSGTATLSGGGRHMAGTVKDGKGTYTFVLDRAGAAAVTAGAGREAAVDVDLRGNWEGTYAGARAQLTIDRREGAVFGGVLIVTTAAGKDPSEIEIQARVSGQSIELRETKLLKLGAARSWSLGAGSGTLQPNGQLSGTGKDDSRSYRWAFTRR